MKPDTFHDVVFCENIFQTIQVERDAFHDFLFSVTFLDERLVAYFAVLTGINARRVEFEVNANILGFQIIKNMKQSRIEAIDADIGGTIAVTALLVEPCRGDID